MMDDLGLKKIEEDVEDSVSSVSGTLKSDSIGKF